MLARPTFLSLNCRSLALALLAILVIAGGCNRSPNANRAVSAAPQKSRQELAAEHYQVGLKLSDEGKLDDAIDEFTTAIRMNPSDSQAYLSRGKAFVAKGLPNLGVDDFTASLHITPDVHEAVLARAQALLTAERPTEAVEDGRLAVRLDPNSAKSYDTLGLAYTRAKRHEYELAVTCFQEATRLDPKLASRSKTQIAQAYYDLAMDLDRQGQTTEAEVAFAEAKQRDPKFDAAYEQFKHAETVIDGDGSSRYEVGYRGGLAATTPPNAKAVELENQANELLNQQEYDKAIECYTEALRQDHRYAAAWFGRGKAFLEHGFPDTAVDDLNVAVGLSSSPVDVLFERGRAYSAWGKHYIAIQDFTEVIRRRPSYTDAYFERGRAHLANRSYDRALADFSEAEKREPELTSTIKPLIADAYRGRAQDKLIGEDFEGSIRDLNESIRLEPKVAASYRVRGIAFARLGKWNIAMANYQRAIKLDPDAERYRLRDEMASAEQHLSESANAK